jgi:hypothetical protein
MIGANFFKTENVMINWEQSNEEILQYLQEDVVVKTGKKLRFGNIEEAFPDSGYRTKVINSLDAVSASDSEAKAVFIAASTEGTDLSDKHAQIKIRQIAQIAKWPDELTNFILSYCINHQKRWQVLGMPEPTIESIQTQREMHKIDVEREIRKQQYNTLRETWISLYQKALMLINQQEQDGNPTPTLNEVIDQLRS